MAIERKSSLYELLRRPEIDWAALQKIVGQLFDLDGVDLEVGEQLEIQAKYAGYIERQNIQAERLQQQEKTALPEDMDYTRVMGLSNEARQRLLSIRPLTIGQAARIPGITPAAISLLLVHLKASRPSRKSA